MITAVQISQLLQSAIVFGTVIMFGALGEILTQKSGNLNLGVPGIMYLGGIAGLAMSYFYEGHVEHPNGFISLILSFIAAFAAAALGGLIYSFLTITLRANQNVTGLTLTIFGNGILACPVSQIFFSYGFMAYLAIIIAVVMYYFLNRTRTGLNLRSVGESPATADAAGINVIRYKYLATCIGAGISGLGGLYYTMDYIKGTWTTDSTIEALGWLAVALVIFATWRPLNAIWGSYLFGVLYWMYLYIPGLTRSSQEIFKMLPYVVTILVLLRVSMRKKREDQPPASLGLSYFREER